MKKNLTLLIGGVQGEGVVSLGTNLIKTLSSLGYYGYGSRAFTSRIKGGNTTMAISIGTSKQLSVGEGFDMILALDRETIELFSSKLNPKGILLADSILSLEDFALKGDLLVPLPITKIAKELEAPIIKSSLALGFLGRLMGIDKFELGHALERRYENKGAEILEKNLKGLEKTFHYEDPIFSKKDYFLPVPEDKSSRPVMLGNEAIGFGALMAGCRLFSAYPITPASEVMEYLAKTLPDYGGIMLQVEDEIAAITMAIGASYGGVRAMTATSGPGLSLMMEGISLAGITETPVVVANIQRVGPSTGMPTKHEQSDLFTLYYGGHGEFPSIILAPATVEDCFYDTIKAFNLADQYQCPVFILSDLALGLSPQTIDHLDYKRVVIQRGKVVSELDLQDRERGSFKRYEFTEDGISPRSFPGMQSGGHHVTGLEHNELGLPWEKPENRRKMMEKRLNKVAPLENEEGVDIYRTRSHNKTLVLTFGSVFGIVKEAMDLLDNKADYGAIRRIKPLPKRQLANLLQDYEQIIVVENNYLGQLASLIKTELDCQHKIKSITKYDGTSFSINELASKIGEWI